MKVVVAGHKERGVECIRALVASSNTVVGAVAHPPDSETGNQSSFFDASQKLDVPVFAPEDVNQPENLERIRLLAPDIVVLAGFGQIVQEPFLGLAPRGCINLHGGRLPQYRGSSPMNWALISGDQTFAVSVIAVNRGIDTGDVLLERSFPVGVDDTIVDLHKAANEAFPEMVVTVIDQIEKGTVSRRKQDESRAAYYPVRFPDDGLLFWDQVTALQAHNRIRALTSPYPCASTFYGGMRVRILGSQLRSDRYHGQPGRIYRIDGNRLLVAASDVCLWITAAVIEETGESLVRAAKRYEALATIQSVAVQMLTGGAGT